MVGHGGSSASSYLADPTSPIPSHCVSIVVTSTLRVNNDETDDGNNTRWWHKLHLCNILQAMLTVSLRTYNYIRCYSAIHLCIRVLCYPPALTTICQRSMSTNPRTICSTNHTPSGSQIITWLSVITVAYYGTRASLIWPAFPYCPLILPFVQYKHCGLGIFTHWTI